MRSELDLNFFSAELRCLILKTKAPVLNPEDARRVERALWKCLREISGEEQFKRERQVFDRLYASSVSKRETLGRNQRTAVNK